MIFAWSGIADFLLWFGKDSYRIIYYHVITENNRPNDLPYTVNAIDAKLFEKQIRFLKKRFKIISIKDAIEKVKHGELLRGCLSISTDDGFIENYTVIAPILADYNITATFFLISNCIDNRDLMWRNKIIYLEKKEKYLTLKKSMTILAEKNNLPIPKENESLSAWCFRTWSMAEKEGLVNDLWSMTNAVEPIETFLHKYKPYMTIKQIKELISSGFDIGSHSKSHPYCSMLKYDELNEEIHGSIESLSQSIGTTVSLFSYPFGPRAKPEYEKRLIEEGRVESLIGINNQLRNFNNPYMWERDPLEASPLKSYICFVMKPMLRYWIKI